MTDDELMALARDAAGLSPDPNTQTGAAILTAEGAIYTGRNDLPPNVDRRPERLERPAKYDWLCHAEVSAIADAAKNGSATYGATMALTWYPCLPCAHAMVRAKIKRLVCVPARMDDPRYTFAGATEVLLANGVEIVERSILREEGK